MAEAVRLVIWDMDETFWRGTLTEGGVTWRADTAEIVVELARRGIMSSICSKNDFATVHKILTRKSVWRYFIFPSIDWTPKGPRIQRLIETVQLRAPSVMLIDDNHLNLEEAKFFAPGLQVASDAAIPTLLADPRFQGKDDRGLTRLKQYKVLESRKADEERAREETGGDNVEFLRSSDIRVRIENDVEAHLDRAIELINRTNQLNFTKRRLPEDLDEARERLRSEISHFTTQAGLIEVSDRYGDYGFCGYFQVSTRREVAQLRQFCFSCRILDMGVEAWVYQRLGKPALQAKGEVLSDPSSHPLVDWIALVTEPGSQRSAPAKDGAPDPGSVAIRGGCVLWPLVHYFQMSSQHIVSEFNTIRGGKIIPLDQSICLRNAMLGVTEEQVKAVAPLGYVAEDFKTDYFKYSGERPVWIFSNWIDAGMKLFRHSRTGIVVPYLGPRFDSEVEAHAGVADYLTAEFTPFAYDETEFKKTLAMIFEKIPSHGLLFLLLSRERVSRPSQARMERNRWRVEAAGPHPNVRPLRMGDFIEDETEILNAKGTHYDRKVYHRLYRRILAEVGGSPEMRCEIGRGTS
jgi:FkbH-like protein